MSTATTPIVKNIHPDKGSLGGKLQIYIHGSDFSGTNVNVFFDNVGASDIQVVNPNLITATSPAVAQAKTAQVTVNVDGNVSKTSSASQFTYKNPEVKTVSPSSGPIAGGTRVDVRGSYFTGAAAVLFGKAGGTQFKAISDTHVAATSPNTSKTGDVPVSVVVQGQASSQRGKFTYNEKGPGVPLLFSSSSPSETYIYFLGDADLEGHYYDSTGVQQNLTAATGYSLAELTSSTPIAHGVPANTPAVLIQEFSGRVYLSQDSLAIPEPSYIPDAGGSSDPNYKKRYQYFESTITGGAQVFSNLSYIDFTAISLSLNAHKAPNAGNPHQKSTSSHKLIRAAGAASQNAAVIPSSQKEPFGPQFARVISPQLGAAGFYHDFAHYLKTTLSGKKVFLRGIYAGTGPQPAMKPGPEPIEPPVLVPNPDQQAQSYAYTAEFDGDLNQFILTPNSGSGDGHASGVPTSQQGPGVGDNDSTAKIVIDYDDLNQSSGVYGCNAPYTRGNEPKTAGITNDFWGWVVGDLLAGLNFGYPGSPTPFPQHGSAIGDQSSTEWWGGTMPSGTVINPDSTPGGQDIYFSGVQGNAQDYNSYAGSLNGLTAGYGFPLQDRLGRNLLTMNTATDKGSYLKVSIDLGR